MVTGVNEIEKFTDVTSVNEYEVINKIELLDNNEDVIKAFEDNEYTIQGGHPTQPHGLNHPLHLRP